MKISQDVINKVMNRRRFAWVDSVMKEELPSDIYGAMHSQESSERGRAASWLRERGYRVVDAGDGVVQVLRGANLVRQAKMVLELDDPNEMLSVMEQAYNANIPAPPWANEAK